MEIAIRLKAGKPKLWLKRNAEDQPHQLCDQYLDPKTVPSVLREIPEMFDDVPDEGLQELIQPFIVEPFKDDVGSYLDMKKFLNSISKPVADKITVGTPVSLTVEPPNGTERAPVDICCVIDVSGSMGTEATIQSTSGSTERHGLSLLDIAKHGLRTVIKTLGAADRLSLVLFNHESQVVFTLLEMDDAGQTFAMEKLNDVRAGGGTHIWNGLLAGLRTLKDDTKIGSIGHIMLLTDGQTMQRDDVMRNLKEYQEQNEGLPGTISTFGFGYSIDSDLICQIADVGDGTYSFIPDAGFVGTVFVKTLSNLLVTIGREMTLSLDVDDCDLVDIMGQYKYPKPAANIYSISMGTLQYEQSRSLVFVVNAHDDAEATLAASVSISTGSGRKEIPGVEFKLSKCENEMVEPELLRCRYIDTVTQCLKQTSADMDEGLAQAQKAMAALADEIQRSPAADQKEIQALLQDVKGQSLEAVSKKEWFQKWGIHYLPSIMFAHRAQQSNNFKDPSVQFYGGTVFNDMVDRADDVFNSLPAPEPSVRRPVYSGATAYSAPAPVSMAAYNDRYGVCIDASSLAKLADTGRLTPVGELRQGDVVIAPEGAVARVVCVIRTVCAAGKASLAELSGGARVTPFHPICWKGEWRFPADVADVQERECQAVCSIILHGAPALLVGFASIHEQAGNSEDVPAVACVALGHGLEEGAAKHPYFGTQRVLEDLECAPGYKNGMVEVQSGNILRDANTGLVCSFNFQQ